MFKKLSLTGKIVIQTLLVFVGIIYLIPLVNVVVQSFNGAGIGNYTYLFTSGFPITRMIFNSFFISIMQVTLIIAVASPAAFAFSKIRFPGRDLIYMLIMLTMSISMLCFITPLYQTMKTLGWMNTYLAMILPAATFWIPVGILILKNYYDSLGMELLEATMIEGGGFLPPGSGSTRRSASPRQSMSWCSRSSIHGTTTSIRSFLPAPKRCAPCRWRCCR